MKQLPWRCHCGSAEKREAELQKLEASVDWIRNISSTCFILSGLMISDKTSFLEQNINKLTPVKPQNEKYCQLTPQDS